MPGSAGCSLLYSTRCGRISIGARRYRYLHNSQNFRTRVCIVVNSCPGFYLALLLGKRFPIFDSWNKNSISNCPDMHRHLSRLLILWGSTGSESTEESQASSHLGGSKMETILIILLVVFLLGGGGWGYSRWRRN